jgi:phosphoribosylaminoimidazole-succinocarboxamide synthase
MQDTLFESHIPDLALLHRGKVRDLYQLDPDHLLIVTTDRISAFDVVLPTPIPGKGEILTAISNLWFTRTRDRVPNHLTGRAVASVIDDPALAEALARRAVIVRRLTPLPVEAIVRGYLIGSGWKDYQREGAICGIPLPRGLRLADKLPEALFTPSTKADAGAHDQNIDFARSCKLIGTDRARQVRETSLALYLQAAEYARGRGIIIADTKFEFGLDEQGRLVLMDEVLTPDSSRFWPVQDWRPGTNPPSFDKQYVRDFLETLDWDKTSPGPALPEEIIRKTAQKYRQALDLLST